MYFVSLFCWLLARARLFYCSCQLALVVKPIVMQLKTSPRRDVEMYRILVFFHCFPAQRAFQVSSVGGWYSVCTPGPNTVAGVTQGFIDILDAVRQGL